MRMYMVSLTSILQSRLTSAWSLSLSATPTNCPLSYFSLSDSPTPTKSFELEESDSDDSALRLRSVFFTRDALLISFTTELSKSNAFSKKNLSSSLGGVSSSSRSGSRMKCRLCTLSRFLWYVELKIIIPSASR